MNRTANVLEISDGRRRRSEASRERIVSALFELLAAGDVTPSAEAVADRAGVGLRTVFRHFENMESLFQQINATMEAEIRPAITQGWSSQGGQSRLEEMLDRRIVIFEKIMPLKIAADVHRHRSAFLEAQARVFVREQREMMKAGLSEIVTSDPDLLEALDLLLSFDTWRRLRRDQRLSVPRAREVLRSLLLKTAGYPAP